MNYVLIVLLGDDSWYGIATMVLYIVGLWFLLKKSGVPSWWALIPFAREYMLSKCAGREPEGRIASFLAAAATIVNVLYTALAVNQTGLLTILLFALELILLNYRLRIARGLIEVYGTRRGWIWLWAFVKWLPAIIWGLNPKYQPAWKMEDLEQEIAAITRNGSAEVLEDGLTVDLRERTVTESFKKKYLLKNVHLSIQPGHMVLLLGGSGAGKTVFLDAISGFEKADADILLAGGNMYTEYKKMQYQVGYAPQKDTMRGKDTVFSTLMDAAKLRLPMDVTPEDRKKRVEEVMDIFGLTPSKDHLIEKLSGGQKKRVSIAIELLSNPSLFILDEPDSGLDGVMARELMKELRRIADQGKIIIVITHTPDRVIDLFDDVIVLAKDANRVGRLAFFGSIPDARAFFGKESMEDVVKTINSRSVGGEGRADEYIAMYEEAHYA